MRISTLLKKHKFLLIILSLILLILPLSVNAQNNGEPIVILDNKGRPILVYPLNDINCNSETMKIAPGVKYYPSPLCDNSNQSTNNKSYNNPPVYINPNHYYPYGITVPKNEEEAIGGISRGLGYIFGK